MLPDKTDSLASPVLVAAPLCAIEKAWIYSCQLPECRRRLHSSVLEPGGLAHMVLAAMERILEAGAIGGAHAGVLVMHGQRGHPPNINCAIAYGLWTEAMLALEAEVKLRLALAP
jgi:hypothetical protein